MLLKINKRPHWNKCPPSNFAKKLISVHNLTRASNSGNLLWKQQRSGPLLNNEEYFRLIWKNPISVIYWKGIQESTKWNLRKTAFKKIKFYFKFFKGCLPQILLGPFFNTLIQWSYILRRRDNLFCAWLVP